MTSSEVSSRGIGNNLGYVLVYTALKVVMTSIFVWGLLERRDWTVLRMGWDSLSVLVLCVLGIVGFYFVQ